MPNGPAGKRILRGKVGTVHPKTVFYHFFASSLFCMGWGNPVLWGIID